MTDVGNIDDHSFNQYSYEGVTKFCSNAGLECSYYKPAGDTDQDRIDAINQAVKDGYGVVVMAGYLFGPACYTVATEHPEVLFLALDVTEGDLKAESVPSNIALILIGSRLRSGVDGNHTWHLTLQGFGHRVHATYL